MNSELYDAFHYQNGTRYDELWYDLFKPGNCRFVSVNSAVQYDAYRYIETPIGAFSLDSSGPLPKLAEILKFTLEDIQKTGLTEAQYIAAVKMRYSLLYRQLVDQTGSLPGLCVAVQSAVGGYFTHYGGAKTGEFTIDYDDPFQKKGRGGYWSDRDVNLATPTPLPPALLRKLLMAEMLPAPVVEGIEPETEMWPATGSFSTQYFANIGWYIPVGYVLDPISTALVWQRRPEFRFNYLVLRTTLAYLDRNMFRMLQVWNQVLSPAYLQQGQQATAYHSTDWDPDLPNFGNVVNQLGPAVTWLTVGHGAALAVTATAAAVAYLESWANYNVSSKVMFWNCKENAAFGRGGEEGGNLLQDSVLREAASSLLRTSTFAVPQIPRWTPTDIEYIQKIVSGEISFGITVKAKMPSYRQRDLFQIYYLSPAEEQWFYETFNVILPFVPGRDQSQQPPSGGNPYQDVLGMSVEETVDSNVAGGNTY